MASSVVPLRLTSSGATFAGSISASEQSVFTGNAISGTPNSNAQIVAADSGVAGIAIHSNDGGQGYLWFGDNTNNAVGRIYYNHSTDKVHWRVGGTDDAHTLDSSGNATFAGDITSGGLTVDYTGHRTGDAGLLVTNDASDWGVKIDKDGTDTYGLLVQADGTHAIMVRSSSGVQKALISGTGNADFEGTLTSGAITSTGNMSLSNSGTGNNITINRTDSSTSAVFHIGSSRGYVGTTTDHVFEIRQNDTPAITIDTSGNTTVENNLVVDGNLTVSGTTTTIDTANLNVEDNNITLNYSTGDSSASANGAGITIQDAVSSTNDATILWNSTDDTFDFSHGISSGPIVAEGAGTTSSTNALKVTKNGGESTFTVRDDGVVLVQSNYLYVNNNGGFYSTGAIRARGGITNDGGNALSISSGAAHIAFNSKNFASVGTISSGAITTTGDISLNKADGFIYLNNVGTGNSGIYVRGITSSNTLRSHTTDNFRWEVSGSQKMELDSAGRLKIGTTSTTPAFSTGNGHVFHVGDASHISRSGGVALVVNRAASNGEAVQVRRDGTHVGGLGIAGGANLTVNSAGSGGYGRLQDNGSDVAIWWTNGFYPATDNAKDLGVGSTSGRWRRLYMADAIWMNGSKIVDASRNLLNIGSISSGSITSSNTITAPTLIAGAYGAAGSAGDGFRINSTDIYGQLDSTDKIHISAVTGNISGVSGHVSGKFAVNSTGVHASYDFYNNGTTYLNGSTIIDDSLDLTGGNAALKVAGTTVIDSTRRARMSVLLPTDTTLYATDASLSYFSSSNAVYLNGAGANGWLRLNASGNANDRTAINLFGQNAGDNITFKTASSERMRLASNGDWIVSNTNPRVASQFTNQAGIGWYDADLHAEIATTGNRSALELGRNNSTATGDFLVFRKQATVIGSIGVEGGDSLYIQSDGSTGGGLRFHQNGVISPVRNGAVVNNTIDLGTSSQQFRELYLGSGLFMSGSQVINSSRKLVNSTGATIAHSEHQGVKITGTDSSANTSFTSMLIDHNASGSTALTADRSHIGLQIDMDSSATGGDTSNEHRLYGIHNNVKATGDSDLVYGVYSIAEAEQTAGQVSILAGVFGQATTDAVAGTISNSYGVYGYNSLTASSGTTISNAFAVYGKALVGAAQDSNVSQVSGLYAEVEIDASAAGTTVSSVYGVRSEIDNDAGTADTTITNSFLFYGNYAGDLATSAYGVYIPDNVRNYFGGNITTGDGSTSTASYGFNGDTNTGMYSPANHQLGFTVNGTQRLQLDGGGATVTGAIDVDGEFKSTSQSSNAVKTRFIAGAAAGSTSNGPLYINYGKTDGVNVFQATSGNPNLLIYGNDNGTQRYGSLSVGTDGSFNVSASDTYLILNAASYIQSNKGHNFLSTLMMSGTTILTSARVLQNVTANASIITAGTLSGDRIPNLSGDKITAVTNLSDTTWHDVVVSTSSGLRKDTAVEIHGSGYLRAAYLNMTHGVNTRNSDDVFFSSNDTYIRKNNAAGFRTSLDVYSKSEAVSLSGTQTITGAKTHNADLTVGTSTTDSHLRLYKADNNVSDHLIFFMGSTRMGEIGTQDTTWLRINQVTNKNIYTPRYIRADNGFRVDGTTYGIMGDGTYRAPNGTVSAPSISFGLDNNCGLYVITTDTIGLTTGGTQRQRWHGSGSNVTGDLTASGNVTAYSDERLKSDIKTASSEAVYQMRGTAFIKDGKAGAGVIAQEIERVTPHLVHEQDDGYKSVNYMGITAYLIEAVKAQKETIDQLTKRIEELENGNH